MDDVEKAGRLEAAAVLLSALKSQGVPARKVAKELKVSATTVSHWLAMRSGTKSRVGAPSDAQLNGMESMLKNRLVQNLGAFRYLLRCGALPPFHVRELAIILVPLLNDTTALLERMKGQIQEMYQESASRLEPLDYGTRVQLAPVVYRATERWGVDCGGQTISARGWPLDAEQGFRQSTPDNNRAQEQEFTREIQRKLELVEEVLRLAKDQ